MTEQETDALITDRILLFYDALLKRGQIAAPTVGALNPRISDSTHSDHPSENAPLGDTP